MSQSNGHPVKITKSKFYIYGIPDCKWCRKAIDLAISEDVDYEYLDITEDPYLEEIARFRGWTSFPQVMIAEYEVGGYEKFKEFLNNA